MTRNKVFPVPVCWSIEGWDDLSQAQRSKHYRTIRRKGREALKPFMKWLCSYSHMTERRAAKVAGKAWTAMAFSDGRIIDWINDLDLSPKRILDYIDAMRMYCRWHLGKERLHHDDREWARTTLDPLNEMYKRVKGRENELKAQVRKNDFLEPLSEVEIQEVEEAIAKSYSHPQFPWSKHLLQPLFSMGCFANQIVHLTPDDIEQMVRTWRAGGSPMVGALVAPLGRNASSRAGRRRLYPAHWGISQLEGLLEWPAPWECVAQVVLPRTPRTKGLSKNHFHVASRTMNNRLVEVVTPLVIPMRKAPRLKRVEALMAFLQTTTQARLIRELGDWATAAQIKDWSINHLKKLKWAQDAYQGPDEDSIWNDICRVGFNASTPRLPRGAG